MNKKTTSDRRRSGNQVVFRGRNEKARKNIDVFNETASELGEEPVDTTGKAYLQFVCECSDEKCSERIIVTFVDYQKIHKARDMFVVKPDHVVYEIEDVTKRTPDYWIVKKHEYPSQTVTKLRVSGLNHSS